MSENDKDNKVFDFINEQVIEKKRRKIKKWLLPLMLTVFMAIIFGMIAAITFVITEPRLYKYIHKVEEIKTPISFPTENPEDPLDDITVVPIKKGEEVNPKEEEPTPVPDTIIMEQSIDADLEDFISMYDELRTVAIQTNKSLINITSIINDKDWFGNPVERIINTTGVIISDKNDDLLILVSLDRVKDANSIKIIFSESEAVDAVLQDYETEINLAVIAVSIEDIPSFFMDNIQVATLGESYTITVGSPIIALGSPNGHPGSIEFGIVTSRGSWVNITDNRLDLFNTDLKDNKNSDGIIVNLKGEIIGLMTRNLKEDINVELNTVIGISKVKSIIERMASKKPRIYFGVKTEDMTEAVKTEKQIINGIYVNEVQANSPAFAAGMKNGDIILQIDNQSIMNTSNFYNTITEYQPEEQITVKIKRSTGSTEKEMDLVITLTEKAQ